jgi:HK97 family phage major capsid protein
MKRSEALTVTVEALRSELLELDAIDAPTDDQVARSTAALAEYDAAFADLEAARAHETKMDAIRAAIDTPSLRENGFGGNVNVSIKRDPFENVEALRFVDPRSEEVVARAVTAISEVTSRGTSDSERDNAVRMIENIPGAAVHALVFGSPAYRSAFERWGQAAAQGMSPVYTAAEADAVRAGLSLTSGNGGAMLPFLLDPTLIKTGTAVKDNIRSIARVETISQNAWHGATVGNVTAYWTAEASAFTEGNPTLTQPAITAQKLTAYLPGSIEIFEDSTLLAQLPGLIAEGMSFVEQTAFVSGNGTTQPLGVITAISATAGSTVTITTRGSFTTASSADVYAIVNAVTPRYEESATWLANKATFNLVNQMSPSGGGSLFWGNFDTAGWKKPPLLGSPVVSASDVANTYTSGTVFAILGDFSQYLIADRIGTTVEFVQNVFNSTPLPTGQRALVAHKRVGAGVTDINAFRFLKA